MNRNGNYDVYAIVVDRLWDTFQQLSTKNITIPHLQNVMEDAEFLAFQIKMMTGLYRFSNLPRTFGGAITYAGINSEGLRGVNLMLA